MAEIEFYACTVTLAIKVTIGQIHDGSVSQNKLHNVYNVCVQSFMLLSKSVDNSVIFFEYAPIIKYDST